MSTWLQMLVPSPTPALSPLHTHILALKMLYYVSREPLLFYPWWTGFCRTRLCGLFSWWHFNQRALRLKMPTNSGAVPACCEQNRVGEEASTLQGTEVCENRPNSQKFLLEKPFKCRLKFSRKKWPGDTKLCGAAKCRSEGLHHPFSVHGWTGSRCQKRDKQRVLAVICHREKEKNAGTKCWLALPQGLHHIHTNRPTTFSRTSPSPSNSKPFPPSPTAKTYR